ncbi:MAG TPA: hypothetical protein VMV27_00255 [Candidatus Binataceae bacterium]|nr:hypothetical protein [Candidatus Binataceae bacterium]
MAAQFESVDHSSRRLWWLFLLLAFEVVANSIGWLPSSLGFDHFAFCDQGANLTVQYLTSRGMTPAIDFGYAYGLIPLAVGKLWFGWFGATPFAYQALMAACGILIALGLAQIAVRLKFGAIGTALLAIALTFIIQASYPSLSQATEQILMTFAIAQQAAGRRSGALALTTAAALAKPSMAYVYGFILTLLIALDLLRSRGSLRQWIRAFAPAAVIGILLAIMLGLVYGPAALLNTVFPVEGMRNYRALNFGFFTGSGQGFWNLGNMPLLAYLLEVSGFWMASTAVLLIAAPFAALKWFRAWRADLPTLELHRAEIVVTCAVLHVVFVTLLFGNEWSWFYYAYVLVVAVATISEIWPMGRRTGVALCALGLISCAGRVWSMYHHWTIDTRYVSTDGLWASREQIAEWNKALSLVQGRNAVVLDINGALELMMPGFAPPTTLYLLPGLMQPVEVDRKLAQLNEAQVVLVPYGILSGCRGVPDNPAIKDALNSLNTEWKGRYYEVFRRRSKPADRPTLTAPVSGPANPVAAGVPTPGD